MSKKAWFAFIIVVSIIGVLLASRYVSGFDKGANDYVIDPIHTSIVNFTSMIVAHPIWQAYGYPITFIGGIVFTAAFALILWPKIKKGKPEKIVSELQDKVSSAPTKIPKAPTKPEKVATKTIVEPEEESTPVVETESES